LLSLLKYVENSMSGSASPIAYANNKMPPVSVELAVEANNKIATSIGPMHGVQESPKIPPNKNALVYVVGLFCLICNPEKPFPSKMYTPNKTSRMPATCEKTVRCVLKKFPTKVALIPSKENTRARPKKNARDMPFTFFFDASNVYAMYAGKIGNVHGEINDNNPAKNATNNKRKIELSKLFKPSSLATNSVA